MLRAAHGRVKFLVPAAARRDNAGAPVTSPHAR
jgi:hypothetical protein